jgi:hypothetical protein
MDQIHKLVLSISRDEFPSSGTSYHEGCGMSPSLVAKVVQVVVLCYITESLKEVGITCTKWRGSINGRLHR